MIPCGQKFDSIEYPLRNCYGNAMKLARKIDGCARQVRVVHGRVRDCDAGDRWIHHAWVEADGRVLDPTFDIDTTRADWRSGRAFAHERYQGGCVRGARAERRYNLESAMLLMLRTGNYGPWTRDEESVQQAATRRRKAQQAAARGRQK